MPELAEWKFAGGGWLQVYPDAVCSQQMGQYQAGIIL